LPLLPQAARTAWLRTGRHSATICLSGPAANRAGTPRREFSEAPESPARISWIFVFIDTSPKNLLTPGRPKRVGRPPTHAK